MQYPEIRHFSGWSRPFTELLADSLLAGRSGGGPPDLGNILVVVPTREAGRLFRETLAEYAGASGVLPPAVALPESLVRPEAPASPAAVLQAWLAAFDILQPRQLPALFGKSAAEGYDRNWLLGTAGRIQELRLELAGAGHSLSSALDALAGLRRDNSRFRELIRLEDAYLDCLAGGAAADPARARLACIEAPAIPETVDTVIFGCVADPLPAAIAAARNWHGRKPGRRLEFHIAAPEEYAAHFDAAGRPEPDFWSRVEIDIDLERQFRRYSRPDAMARRLAGWLRHGYRPGAIGVLDAETGDALAEELRDTPDIELYLPRRTPLATLPCGRFMLALAGLAETPIDYATVSEIVRNGFFLDSLPLDGPGRTGLLSALDQWQNRHLIQRFDDFRQLRRFADYGDIAVACDRLEQWRNQLRSAPCLPAAIHAVAGEVFAGMPASPAFAAEAEAVTGIVAAVAMDASGSDALAVFRNLLHSTEIDSAPDRSGAVDLTGYLELPWRRDRELVIAGFSEENFHYASAGDAFLPDRARDLLGLSDSHRRYACDAYALKCLAEARRERGGRLILLAARSTLQGEVLRPSRLLLHAPAEELPRRVRAIWEGGLDETLPGRIAPEPLLYTPRAVWPPPSGGRISVTALKSYLECPFRFYLAHILRARQRLDRSLELDSLQYGDGIHAVLDQFARRHSAVTGAAEAAALLDRLLEERFEQEFAVNPGGVARIQYDLMRRSLEYFAAAQEQLALEGWEIAASEQACSFHWDRLYHYYRPEAPALPWRGEIVLAGRLDRIDRHRESGLLRIVDYKTNRSPVPPAADHATGLPRRHTPEEWAWRRAHDRTSGRGKCSPGYWSDLQLPLYVLALNAGLVRDFDAPELLPEAGYFHLPLAVTDTGFEAYREIGDPDALMLALDCADRVLERIFVQRLFGPPEPVRNRDYDLWYRITGDPAVTDIAPEWFAAGGEA